MTFHGIFLLKRMQLFYEEKFYLINFILWIQLQ